MESSLHPERVALVTGAARRIGASVVARLHAEGFRVVIHCHHSITIAQDQVKTYLQQRVNSACMLSADLCQVQDVFAIIPTVIEWAGRLDLLVNNASIFSKKNSDWAAMLACNVQAPYALSHAAYPYLQKNKGTIINLTDIHAHAPLSGYAAYCQSKAALDMQTRALALEFAPDVRVNAIAPGAMAWPEGDNQLSHDDQQKIIAKTPLRCHGDPTYIAEAVMYLVNNPFVTGESLHVDGGRHLKY